MLVIIGLLVGGVLVGNDLIASSNLRGTITQVEKYNQAVNTFKAKFGELPGDMEPTAAAQFGFLSRPGSPGAGDGNGVIEGNSRGYTCGFCGGTGEGIMAWNDLSTANLIDFQSTANSSVWLNGGGGAVSQYFPAAKIGNGNFFSIWSGGVTTSWGAWGLEGDDHNYFALTGITQVHGWPFWSSTNLTVKQAYNIDSKIDDGLPQTGNVITLYINNNIYGFASTWAAGNAAGALPGTPAASSPTTCYDNGGDTTGLVPMTYSLSQNNGAGANCALSFKFQ